MLGQSLNAPWASSDGVYTHTWTYQVTHPGRTIVEVALTSLNSVDDDDGTFGRFGISQIVSDKGVENFGDDGPPVLARDKVTSVTVEMFVDNSFARGRVSRNFW